MKKLNVYFREQPLGYKWIPGDRYVISRLKRLFKGKRISGLEKVFINLCKGLDELGVDYVKNRPFKKIQPGEPVIVLGVGKYALKGYDQQNPVIAGIGLASHPAEWPDLFTAYPVAKYLQHSDWAMDIYIPWYEKENCDTWPSGIDTGHWSPIANTEKKVDFLVYSKFLFDREKNSAELKQPILNKLNELSYSYREIVYGHYTETEFHDLLQQCKAMIFLCEHESQGFACCETMAMNVPVFAWDQGFWLDPNRFKWNNPVVPATSVPFFDERCGMTFKDFDAFEKNIAPFFNKVKNGDFAPREYVLQNLTLKKSAERMLEIVNSVYK